MMGASTASGIRATDDLGGRRVGGAQAMEQRLHWAMEELRGKDGESLREAVIA